MKPSRIRRGDLVVHTAFGVGRFEGVYSSPFIVNGEADREQYLKVAFRDRTLEMPASQRSLLKLFRRQEELDELSPVKLDSTRAVRSWERRKTRAAKNVLDVAADLLKMYAKRQEAKRVPCKPDGERFRAFAQSFAYTPTADQLKTFNDIESDMVTSERPMDRLVCGDVGYGKTEVAMRATYRAVCNGRQVALLAPTTVLAAQHLRVLRQRMPDVRIEMLSSLVKRTAAQRAQLLEEVQDGRVEVLVGTQALLTDKVRWGRLGLLVVDEEQRFGVKQKEKIKNASLAVDVLALSATPIPRTMYMCMAGIREMSTLKTAPPGRLPVLTTVMARKDDEVVDAIARECARGGQVFYVVPRIEMIQRELALLQRLLPGLTISFAYGGLKKLEQLLVDFALGKFDVLVSTTIMENGIDIPNVNTIVIQDTHLFGLSQLHQLRGRVGRSNLQAHALMLHPDASTLGDDALRRLKVLRRETGLGAGLNLAKSDLQIRGAGNLFGTEQKGTYGARDIGVDMYMETLQRAMKFLEQQQRASGSGFDEDALLRAAMLDDSMLLSLADSLGETATR